MQVGKSSATARDSRNSARSVERCRRKFLAYFPNGFADEHYLESERAYKWDAHILWSEDLGQARFFALLDEQRFLEVARRAVRIESRTNLLFSFEKMALRDAVNNPDGAETFACGLYSWLHGSGSMESRFGVWIDVIERLPRRQTRVLTWPIATVFGFIAQPSIHLYLKPTATREATRKYGFDFLYQPRPTWGTYSRLLAFGAQIQRDCRDLRPKDMVDIQSFIWVQGSAEYG